jgi:hypothetical protein
MLGPGLLCTCALAGPTGVKVGSSSSSSGSTAVAVQLHLALSRMVVLLP